MKMQIATEPLRCEQPAQADHSQLYNLLVSELTDFAVFLMDTTGCIVSWNPGVEQLLGYPEAEWVGQPAHITFTPEERAAGIPDEEMTKAAGSGRVADIRWHQRKDGRFLFVECTTVGLKDARGRLLGFSKVLRDITARKQAEDALRASDERSRALLTASSDVLYRMSYDWAEMRQLGGDGFIPDTHSSKTNWLDEYIPPIDQPKVLEAIAEAIRTKSIFELEHRVQRSDGTFGWTHSRAVPLFGASGEITEWFGAATDITPRKEAEVERERLVEELARSNEDLSQFARIASHDLRAPLNTITQFSQLLRKKYKEKALDQNAKDYLDLIIGNALRMSALTSDLLRFSEVSSCPLVPANSIRMGGMVEMALANLQSEIEKSDAVVTCEALPEVKIEETYLVQLVQNLIANAIKYRSQDAPRIHIAVEEQGDNYRFSVKDNGEGIERHYQERITEQNIRRHLKAGASDWKRKR